MINLHEFIRDDRERYRKIEADELLFAEYLCEQEATRFGIWSDCNYFAFVFSGQKMWRSIENDYLVEEGDILFVKQGANLAHQYFDDDFCAIFVFLPDRFIIDFLQRQPTLAESRPVDQTTDAVIRLQCDPQLELYRDTLHQYLYMEPPPSSMLLRHKFEELLLSLILSQQNKDLSSHFFSLGNDKSQQLIKVMEENYAYNLRLEEFARLCHMSLSTFKRSFSQQYGEAPAGWLRERRLKLAARRLHNSGQPVSQIAFECGFESASHFNRLFRSKFGQTPATWRSK